MQVAPKEDDGELTVQEAVDLTAGAEPEPEKIVIFDTETGEPVNEKPSEGVVESLTVEDAAKLLADYHASQSASAANAVTEEFAAEVDRVRAEALKANPKLAEHFGIEPP